jgi:GNAT superfamily N-acetyltransferase
VLANPASHGLSLTPMARPDSSMQVRPVDPSEVGVLARLWYDGWQDAHAAIVPAELARRRTLPRFEERLRAALPSVRTVGPVGAPLGFAMLKGDELYQLYVSARARGTGVAAVLMADAEARLAASGVKTAWLGCAIGNDRAARFYEKSGWHRARTEVEQLETPEGPFPLELWRYEKRLHPADG